MTISIIVAMDEELCELKSRLQNIQEQTIAKQNFIEGVLEGKRVVILKCGIGKVGAAIGVTLLNQLFKPSCVINVGSGGGFSSKCKVGDLVISSEVRYFDVDLTVFNYEYGQAAQMPATFIPDKKLVKLAESCVKSLSDINYQKGLITTGDSFVTTEQQITAVQKHFPEVCAVEMEGGAVANVCHLFNTPFVILRFISDLVDIKGNAQDFEANLPIVARKTAAIISGMVREL